MVDYVAGGAPALRGHAHDRRDADGEHIAPGLERVRSTCFPFMAIDAAGVASGGEGLSALAVFRGRRSG